VTAAEDAERRAHDIGAHEWLAKPFDLRDLLQVVRRLCPSHEAPAQRV
jgi:DNA-binding response OmpR family regulator